MCDFLCLMIFPIISLSSTGLICLSILMKSFIISAKMLFYLSPDFYKFWWPLVSFWTVILFSDFFFLWVLVLLFFLLDLFTIKGDFYWRHSLLGVLDSFNSLLWFIFSLFTGRFMYALGVLSVNSDSLCYGWNKYDPRCCAFLSLNSNKILFLLWLFLIVLST